MKAARVIPICDVVFFFRRNPAIAFFSLGFVTTTNDCPWQNPALGGEPSSMRSIITSGAIGLAWNATICAFVITSSNPCLHKYTSAIDVPDDGLCCASFCLEMLSGSTACGWPNRARKECRHPYRRKE